MSSSFLLNIAVGQCAKLIADYLDGFGDPARAVTVAALEQAAAQNQPLLMEAVKAAPTDGVAMVRRTFGNLAADLRREHPGGHPYMWVLQQDVLGKHHAGHVQVILLHLAWYRRQMDAAIDWLFGSAN